MCAVLAELMKSVENSISRRGEASPYLLKKDKYSRQSLILASGGSQRQLTSYDLPGPVPFSHIALKSAKDSNAVLREISALSCIHASHPLSLSEREKAATL